jgi:hypothetical protein
MLVKLEPAKNEVEEDEGDAVEQGLNDPSPEGHVDVDDVALFSITKHFLKINKNGFGSVSRPIKWHSLLV